MKLSSTFRRVPLSTFSETQYRGTVSDLITGKAYLNFVVSLERFTIKDNCSWTRLFVKTVFPCDEENTCGTVNKVCLPAQSKMHKGMETMPRTQEKKKLIQDVKVFDWIAVKSFWG